MQVATKEPAKEGQPIVLTVTSNDKPDRRREYQIDPQTKLVERVIEFRRRGDQWEQASVAANTSTTTSRSIPRSSNSICPAT